MEEEEEEDLKRFEAEKKGHREFRFEHLIKLSKTKEESERAILQKEFEEQEAKRFPAYTKLFKGKG